MTDAPEFNEVEVPIAGAGGHITHVPGATYGIPGLAVTMKTFGLFDVTHVPSGLRVCGPWERAGSAALAMVQLGLCFDWDQPEDALREEWGEKGDEPVPFDGCTATNSDGERPMTRAELIRSYKSRTPFDEFPWEEESPWYRAEKLLEEKAEKEPTP